MTLEDYNFREICGHGVLLTGAYIYAGMKEMLAVDELHIPKSMQGALAYGYIDHEAGLSYEFLCPADWQTGEIAPAGFQWLMDKSFAKSIAVA